MEEKQKLVVRLDAALYQRLRFVAKTLGVSMNKLVKAAVERHVADESGRLVEELSPRLEKLKRYAAKPRGLEDALEAVERAELEYGKEDPAEGVRIDPDER